MKNIYKGQIRTNKKGFGYFRNEELESFVEIEPRNLNTALDFDTVEIQLLGKNKFGDYAGKVLKVLKRDKEVWVGIIKEVYNEEKHKKEATFIPDSFRFYPKTKITNLEKFHKLKDNKKILVELVEWKNANHPAKIKIKKILGKIGENETEMQAAVLNQGLIMGFPPEIEEEARKLKARSKHLIDEDRPNRKDLTDLDIFTIDPADAKDFDDAIHVKNLPNGNVEIGVHIADPTFFVKENGIIDKEAKKRATSIYLVDRTIPMLPEVLSNDLCSLNPNEEKMAFSIIWELDQNAQIINEWIGKTIIKSKRRFNYLEAQEIADKGEGDFVNELKTLLKYTDILEKERIKNGSIEFSSIEPKFKMDENKFPYEIYIKPHVRMMSMIEEFALLANKQISRYVSLDTNGNTTNNPFIYRIHDKPKQEKITEVLAFLKKLNIYPDTNEDGLLSAQEINNILDKFKGHPEESVLSLSILRSMQKAKYSTEPIGHFGLNFKYYTHFTSPIRRYPDQIAHKLLIKYLKGENVPEKEKTKIQALAEHSSEMEQKAVTAERDSISFKYCQYFSVRIGEKFSGIITGVKKFGIFVEDEKTYAQGFINVRNLGDDFYEYDDKNQILKGQKNKKIFKIGQKINAKVLNVNVNERKIDLELNN